MTDLEESRAGYVRALEKAVERLPEILAAIPGIRRAVLFGSWVEGRRDLLTDLDILIVMETELDFVTRTAHLHRRLDLGVDFDLLVYTPEEMDWMSKRGFVRRALERGEILYERNAGGRGTKVAGAGSDRPGLGRPSG